MSGIVGILNLTGAPVDPALLRRMTNFMTFRGPDAQQIWVDGNVGFGHTLLRTTEESIREKQPFTLDGRAWIVAEARVDAQSDLIANLAARGEIVERGATDVELLLRAYRVWGEECVEHLLGDFAFAVWDVTRRRLFCARDHLGVKPFFYAHLGACVIFSNTLDCIRQHPSVSEKLNDLAIADFLLFDLNQDAATTTFADIQRIPPAQKAIWSADGMKMSRYWTLPIDEPLYFKRSDDYTDRFKELLDMAVSDRLRTKKIAIFMSGGLDSPTLAATACTILRSRSSDSEVRAFTSVIDGFDQNEKYYAGSVAQHLKIPIHFRDRSTRTINPAWDTTAIHTPEPVVDPRRLVDDRREYQSIAQHSRVLFYGEGPDNALRYEWKPYVSYLATKRCFVRLAGEVCGHMIRHKRIPLLPTIPRMMKQRAQRDRWRVSFPDWFEPSFESRLGLRERWQEYEKCPYPLKISHPVRPVGYQSFQSPLWEALFRSMDAEETGVPVEAHHPFVDLRLLRYMLSVPAIPWCRAKYLERRAMRGVLPVDVLSRPKSPLTSDPACDEALNRGLSPSDTIGTLRKYVNSDRLSTDRQASVASFQLNFRPRALNYWLQNLRCKPHFEKENQENELQRTQ